MGYDLTSEEYAKKFQIIKYYNHILKCKDTYRDCQIYNWVKSGISFKLYKKVVLLLKMIRFEMHEEIRKSKENTNG